MTTFSSEDFPTSYCSEEFVRELVTKENSREFIAAEISNNIHSRDAADTLPGPWDKVRSSFYLTKSDAIRFRSHKAGILCMKDQV